MPTFSRKLRGLARGAVAMLLGMILFEAYAQLTRYVGYGNQRVVANVVRDKTVLTALERGESTLPADGTRVLVLGDSMAYSPGVTREQVWSTLLQERLRLEIDPRATVVNAAKAGGNTWTQLDQARELVPLVKPDVVLLVYNYNDVYRRKDAGERKRADGKKTPAAGSSQGDAPPTAEKPKKRRAKKGHRPYTLANLVEWAEDHSAALDGCLPRVNRQLKAWGFVLPGSLFYHTSKVAYTAEGKGWPKVRELLRELRDVCAAEDATLVVYVLPYFDSLSRDLFAGPRQTLGSYLDDIKVPSGFGFEHFKGRSWQELAVSPFDGHPNPHANREIANVIYDWLCTSTLESVKPGAATQD